MRSHRHNEGFGWAEASIVALALVAVVFFALGEDTETSLFGLASLGLAVVWVLGISRTPLAVLAVILAAFITIALLGGVGQAHVMSTFAHLAVSATLAWGLAQPVWSRLPDEVSPKSARALLVVAGLVVALGAAWEVCEFLADRLLGTSLSISLADTVLDLSANTVGALAGALLARRSFDDGDHRREDAGAGSGPLDSGGG